MKVIYFILIIQIIALNIQLSNNAKIDPNSLQKTVDFSRNGQNWKGLCTSGLRQSPINIEGDIKIFNGEPMFLFNNEEVISGEFNWNGSFYRIDSKNSKNTVKYEKEGSSDSYILRRIIVKTPGEHKVNGNTGDAEIQFVYLNTNCPKRKYKLLVVSVLASTEQDAHPLLANLKPDNESSIDLSVLKQFFSEQSKYYYYKGSQTLPGCNEDTRWVVFKEMIGIDKMLVKLLRKHITSKNGFINGNARALNDANSRKIYEVTVK